jgi:beta-glucosidase/6-phospho-beta-glucosidase/beta-galactosidase
VTLSHWDLPQALQDAYGGFAGSEVVGDFVYYADAVFSHLGRFVKKWITFNEPLVTCDLGFKAGGVCVSVHTGRHMHVCIIAAWGNDYSLCEIVWAQVADRL